MTEKTGGSDVSGTETIAKRQPDGTYALHGYKVCYTTPTPTFRRQDKVCIDIIRFKSDDGLFVTFVVCILIFQCFL